MWASLHRLDWWMLTPLRFNCTLSTSTSHSYQPPSSSSMHTIWRWIQGEVPSAKFLYSINSKIYVSRLVRVTKFCKSGHHVHCLRTYDWCWVISFFRQSHSSLGCSLTIFPIRSGLLIIQNGLELFIPSRTSSMSWRYDLSNKYIQETPVTSLVWILHLIEGWILGILMINWIVNI